MTHKISLWLGLFLIVLFAADWFYFGYEFPVFLGKQLARAVDYIAFWR